MSRLDVMITRLVAQRACIDWAVRQVAADDAALLVELGLGSGRTYDHLRQRAPDSRILVFDRRVEAHPDCVPAEADLVLGDVRRTFPEIARRHAGRCALVHADIGTSDHAENARIGRELAPWIARILRPAGILVGNRAELGDPSLQPLEMPPGAEPGHCFLFGRAA